MPASQHCPHCDYTRMPMEGSGISCPRCAELYSTPAKPKPVVAQQNIPTDPIEKAWYFKNFSELNAEQLTRASQRVEVCTLESMPGKSIEAALGLVSGTFTVAFGAVFEAVAGLARNIRGTGNSVQTEQYIQEGIIQVLSQLRVQAMLSFGAEAIVGIRYQFEEFSGANSKGILAVIGTGTAVNYKKSVGPASSEDAA